MKAHRPTVYAESRWNLNSSLGVRKPSVLRWSAKSKKAAALFTNEPRIDKAYPETVLCEVMSQPEWF
jgi:hypothetical protein